MVIYLKPYLQTCAIEVFLVTTYLRLQFASVFRCKITYRIWIKLCMTWITKLEKVIVFSHSSGLGHISTLTRKLLMQKKKFYFCTQREKKLGEYNKHENMARTTLFLLYWESVNNIPTPIDEESLRKFLQHDEKTNGTPSTESPLTHPHTRKKTLETSPKWYFLQNWPFLLFCKL